MLTRARIRARRGTRFRSTKRNIHSLTSPVPHYPGLGVYLTTPKKDGHGHGDHDSHGKKPRVSDDKSAGLDFEELAKGKTESKDQHEDAPAGNKVRPPRRSSAVGTGACERSSPIVLDSRVCTAIDANACMLIGCFA